jgi:hypothetical protein
MTNEISNTYQQIKAIERYVVNEAGSPRRA